MIEISNDKTKIRRRGNLALPNKREAGVKFNQRGQRNKKRKRIDPADHK